MTGPDEKLALDAAVLRCYNDLRQLARRLRYQGSNSTLSPTALVHEAYEKLLKDPPDFAAKPYDEVLAIFAHVMRQILIDAARRKSAQKRTPGGLPAASALPVEDALTLETAVKRLELENPRQARITDCRFYLGMTVAETAAALGLSKTTVEREWVEARARLEKAIRPTGSSSDGQRIKASG